MRVKKSYGIVADHGRKQLKLEKIYNVDREIRLGLVSYKDGMSVNVLDITDEARELKRLLEEYLGYKKEEEKPVSKLDEFFSDNVRCLTKLPATDGNYQSKLREATAEELEEAIKYMRNSGEKGNLTRIRFCETRLKSVKKRDNKTTDKIKPFTITNKIVNKTLSKTKEEPEYMDWWNTTAKFDESTEYVWSYETVDEYITRTKVKITEANYE